MPRTKSRDKMVMISVHLPKQMLHDIDKLVEDGFFPSRSEVIRAAIRDLIMKKLGYEDGNGNECLVIGR